jgi:signal peptidase I
VQAFYIQMQSMEPTLHQSDRVLVSKFSYRFGDPERGDIVIFSDPRDPCGEDSESPGCNPGLARRAFDWVAGIFGLPGSKEDLVKRIVGLPGETIALHEGDIYVCDTPRCTPLDSSGKEKDGHRVTFPSSDDRGPQEDDSEVAAYRIPKDQYYVMGDNRGASADSRSFGSIRRKIMVGRAFVLIWPISRFRGL